jgi:hypothetical protein
MSNTFHLTEWGALKAGDVIRVWPPGTAFGDAVILGFDVDGNAKVSRPYVYASSVGTTMAEYPKELTPALREVLGMMCFELAPLAHGFRAAGYDIPEKVEAEQAFMLHWLIPFAIEHRERWRAAAGKELAKIAELVKARTT